MQSFMLFLKYIDGFYLFFQLSFLSVFYIKKEPQKQFLFITKIKEI